MSAQVNCSVADPATNTIYDVSADYRETCLHAHDSRSEHLCELTLRARPMRDPEMPSTACDMAVIPTSVLVAVQTKLRGLGGRLAIPSTRDHGDTSIFVVS